MDIGVWGDSITYGSCDSEALGWVGRLRKIRSADKDYEATYNYGLCGDTSSNLLARFSSEFDSNVYGLELVVFAIGMNDSGKRLDTNKCITSLEGFCKNISDLIAAAQERGSKVCIIGLTNVDEAYTIPEPESANKAFLNESVLAYDTVLRDVARDSNTPFVEVFGLLDNSELADGLHPNAQGYEKLFQVISEGLERMQ